MDSIDRLTIFINTQHFAAPIHSSYLFLCLFFRFSGVSGWLGSQCFMQ
jgi:hypothetical protein